MKILCVLLCLTVYVSAFQQIPDDYDPSEWYDEVDFDKLFEESNEENILYDDIISSDEFDNKEKESPINQNLQAIDDEEQKSQPELALNVLDEYSDDYQIEDNRSEVEDDTPAIRKQVETPTQEDLLKEIDNAFKELASKSASQETADDFDAFQNLIHNKDPLIQDMIQKVFSEDDGSKLDLSHLFSDEQNLEEDIVEPLPLPSLNSDNNEEINQNQIDGNEHSDNKFVQSEFPELDLPAEVQNIIDETRKELEKTNSKIAEIYKDTGDVTKSEELNNNDNEKDNIPENDAFDNSFEKDTVAQVYKDLNDDLDKLLETMNKLRQSHLSEEQNPDDSFDIDPMNEPLDKAEDLEILHGDDQSDVFDDKDDTQDYVLKLSADILEDEENAAPYVYENDALEASDNDKISEIIQVDSNPESQFESIGNLQPADSKIDTDQLDGDFNSDNESDESSPNFHPGDSKKDDDQFDTDFNSANSENKFDEPNTNFHPADSKKDDDQFDTDFNSANSENEFDESNPSFHPADSKKDDDQFDTDFNSANSDNEFEESNPSFHPADSLKDDDDLYGSIDLNDNSANDGWEIIEGDTEDANLGLPVLEVVYKLENINETIEDVDRSRSSEVLQETKKSSDKESQAMNNDYNGEEETPVKKITKNVEDLTGPELDQLTKQFAMLHKNELAVDSVEIDADHVRLNAYEPKVVTSPGYPSAYPTTGDSPMDWILDGEGHGIELNVTDLAINSAMGHYLLIKPGGVDYSGSDGIVFAFRLDEPRLYRFRDVDRMFVRFEGRRGVPFLRGFSMSVKMIEPISSGDDEELPEPEPVVPEPQATMTLLLGGVNTTEFEEVREEFRRLLADMATMYINANGIDPGNNSTHFTTQITRTYVCNLNWPGFDSCVEVKFAVPLVYDEEHENGHRLNENDLVAMWYGFIGQDPFASRLQRMGITEYTVPSDGSVLLVWLVIAGGVLIAVMMLACTLWRFSCFNGYTRHYTQADTDSVLNEKRSLDMYPTPHQTLPPIYIENEYKWPNPNFDDARVDIGGFTNNTYVRGDMSDESDIEVSRDRVPPPARNSSCV